MDTMSAAYIFTFYLFTTSLKIMYNLRVRQWYVLEFNGSIFELVLQKSTMQ